MHDIGVAVCEVLLARGADLAVENLRGRTAAAVAEHAEALGMDATADAELLWIAERSLRAPLPDGWRDAWDATHRTPYYFSDAGEGPQWEHPRDAEFRELYEARKAAGPPYSETPDADVAIVVAHLVVLLRLRVELSLT